MKNENYTAILEFEVIAPTNDVEKVGEVLKLSHFGEYCPDNSMRGYSLLHLLDHPSHYRISKIISKGETFSIPAGRELDYLPRYFPETMKYYKK